MKRSRVLFPILLTLALLPLIEVVGQGSDLRTDTGGQPVVVAEGSGEATPSDGSSKTAATPSDVVAAVTSGPEKGTLFIHGGGAFPKEQADEFIRLAGGVDAVFVLIPSADAGEEWGEKYIERSFLRRRGVKNIRVLHTRDRRQADSDEFVAPLKEAGGVWFGGGRQWRLADSYLGTKTQQELSQVLARGGVIGGSSAGATIQGSYLVRGAPEGNHVMMSPGHEDGLGFLKHAAIDQHVLARKRENDLATVIDAHPELLGIGIDEGTAIVVTQDRFRVFGTSRVVIHHKDVQNEDGKRYFLLQPGEEFDLARRRLLKRDAT